MADMVLYGLLYVMHIFTNKSRLTPIGACSYRTGIHDQLPVPARHRPKVLSVSARDTQIHGRERERETRRTWHSAQTSVTVQVKPPSHDEWIHFFTKSVKWKNPRISNRKSTKNGIVNSFDNITQCTSKQLRMWMGGGRK